MEKTWKPTVAGILNIISAAGSLLGLLGIIIAIIAIGSGPVMWNYMPGIGPLEVGIIQAVLAVIAVYLVITGILPLLGGIYALQRKKWGLALAGSIVSIFGTFLFGILSTVFIALSKEEFE